MLKKQKINIKKKNLENKQEKVYQYSSAFFLPFVLYQLSVRLFPPIPLQACFINPRKKLWRREEAAGIEKVLWNKGVNPKSARVRLSLDGLRKRWGFLLSKQSRHRALFMVQFDLLPSSPGNPQGKSSSSSPGVGNCLKRYCPRSREWGKSKITSLWFCEVRVISRAVCTKLRNIRLRISKGKCRNL